MCVEQHQLLSPRKPYMHCVYVCVCVSLSHSFYFFDTKWTLKYTTDCVPNVVPWLRYYIQSNPKCPIFYYYCCCCCIFMNHTRTIFSSIWPTSTFRWSFSCPVCLLNIRIDRNEWILFLCTIIIDVSQKQVRGKVKACVSIETIVKVCVWVQYTIVSLPTFWPHQFLLFLLLFASGALLRVEHFNFHPNKKNLFFKCLNFINVHLDWGTSAFCLIIICSICT